MKYLLAAMELSKSTYYYEIGEPDKTQERNADICSKIESIFQENRGRYGVRRVTQELVRRGFPVNHKRVQRIMKRLGLAGNRPKEKYHSYRGEVGKVANNIISRDFSTDRPLQKWTTDVSQFTLPWWKCYLSPILDMNTNEIISYNLSLSANMEQVKDMPDTTNTLQLSRLFQVTTDYLLNDEYQSDNDLPKVKEVKTDGIHQIMIFLITLEVMVLIIQFMSVVILQNIFLGVLSFMPFIAMVGDFEYAYQKGQMSRMREQYNSASGFTNSLHG